MDFLSTDVLLTIFMKLPCKGILICKCVCKEWYDILSNPNFTTNYARNSPFSYLPLLEPRPGAKSSLILLEFDADGVVIWNRLKPKLPIPNFPTQSVSEDTVIIIGCCNDLLFIRQIRWIPNYKDFVHKVYCCNPLFRGCVEIAEEIHEFRWHLRYTIGYISATDTIKLLRIGHRCDNGVVRQSDILTVGIDRTWRNVDEGSLDWYSDPFFYKVREVCFNGVYHWIVLHKWLYTFDFVEEKTGPKFMLPESLQQSRQHMELAVLNDHISLINIDLIDSYGIHVWTMREYGVSESWYLSRTLVLGDFHPVCPVQGGTVFVRWRGKKMIVTNKGEIKSRHFPQYFKLYGAEFAPIFYPLDQVQMFHPLETWGTHNTQSDTQIQTWETRNTQSDTRNAQSLDTKKKAGSSMFGFFRAAWRKYRCVCGT